MSSSDKNTWMIVYKVKILHVSDKDQLYNNNFVNPLNLTLSVNR